MVVLTLFLYFPDGDPNQRTPSNQGTQFNTTNTTNTQFHGTQDALNVHDSQVTPQSQTQYEQTENASIPSTDSNSNNSPNSNIPYNIPVEDIINFLNNTFQEAIVREIMNGRFGHNGPPKPPSMDNDARKSLPKFIYNEYRKNILLNRGCDTSCSVCIEEFQNEEEIILLPCGHHFHFSCIDPWTQEHNTCPTCRYKMKVTNSEKEKERKEEMIKIYGREQFIVMESSVDIESIYMKVQEMFKSDSLPTILDVKKFDTELETKLLELDALEVDDKVRKERRNIILRIQDSQKLLQEMKRRIHEETKKSLIDELLDDINKEKISSSPQINNSNYNHQDNLHLESNKNEFVTHEEMECDSQNCDSEIMEDIVTELNTNDIMNDIDSPELNIANMETIENIQSMNDVDRDEEMNTFKESKEPPKKKRRIEL